MTAYKIDHARSEWVTLTDEEIDYAQRCGVFVRKRAKARGYRDYPNEGDGPKDFSQQKALEDQVRGYIAELAARSYFGYPMEIDTESYEGSDLPDNIEVKAMTVDWYGLRIPSRMDDSRRVVGVWMEEGKERGPYRVCGWYNAGDGKREEWARLKVGGKTMYAVPQLELRPLSQLKGLRRPDRQFDLLELL